MAELFVKDSNGKIWKDQNSGKIILGKKFSEDVIQDGLVFWGRSDPKLLTLVDGLVSEAYDVRETNFVTPVYGKMTQPNVVNRGRYINGYLQFSTADLSNWQYLSKLTSAKSMFIVAKSIIASTYFNGLGFDVSVGLLDSGVGYKTNSNTACCTITSLQSCYVNGTKYVNSGINSPVNTYNIINSFVNLNKNNQIIYLASGRAAGFLPIMAVLEWGWYNRVLNELEVVYNDKALNERNKIYV